MVKINSTFLGGNPRSGPNIHKILKFQKMTANNPSEHHIFIVESISIRRLRLFEKKLELKIRKFDLNAIF